MQVCLPCLRGNWWGMLQKGVWYINSTVYADLTLLLQLTGQQHARPSASAGAFSKADISCIAHVAIGGIQQVEKKKSMIK